MAVPTPPMSRATSSQHPATTASATADGAVAGGDALPGDDDAPATRPKMKEMDRRMALVALNNDFGMPVRPMLPS
eukprot:jgi/Tetstr1/440289/TSEL_028639.t1